MVDFEKIGHRIREERKLNKRVSQEQMAHDLGYYQADISNLEKAKNGSGITDLYKLDLIADYFNIPLANLIFGMEEDKMVHYYGSKIQLKEIKKPAFDDDMKLALDLLSGFQNVWEGTRVFECGPYKIYVYPEYQITTGHGDFDAYKKKYNVKEFRLNKGHCYIMMDNNILGVMVFSAANTQAFIYRPAFAAYRDFLREFTDPEDLLCVLNPYWALYKFSSDEEKAQYQLPYLQRMDALRALGNMPVIMIESVYIREDCRRHGLFRLCLDLIKLLSPDNRILWLNLEPTSGEEMFTEAGYFPNYSNSDLGQISMNAAIAEKMGFTVDSKIDKREVELEDDDGFKTIYLADVRKAAYLFPKPVRDLLRRDSDLVALGRAKEEIVRKSLAEGFTPVLRRSGKIGDYYAVVQQELGQGRDQGKEHWVYAAFSPERKQSRYGITPYNPFEKGLDHKGQIVSCDKEPDGDNEYFDDLMGMNELLDELLYDMFCQDEDTGEDL